MQFQEQDVKNRMYFKGLRQLKFKGYVINPLANLM